MVAIFKFIISAALLSQVSAVAISKRQGTYQIMTSNNVVPAINAAVTFVPKETYTRVKNAASSSVSAPSVSTSSVAILKRQGTYQIMTSNTVVPAVNAAVTFVPKETYTKAKNVSKRAAIPTTTLSTTVATATAGVLEVGEPVLATRPAGYVKINKAAVTSATSTSSGTVVSTSLPVVGKLIVGDPVLAVREGEDATTVAAQTTMITSVRSALPTQSL